MKVRGSQENTRPPAGGERKRRATRQPELVRIDVVD